MQPCKMRTAFKAPLDAELMRELGIDAKKDWAGALEYPEGAVTYWVTFNSHQDMLVWCASEASRDRYGFLGVVG